MSRRGRVAPHRIDGRRLVAQDEKDASDAYLDLSGPDGVADRRRRAGRRRARRDQAWNGLYRIDRMRALGWRRRWESCPAARRSARQRAGSVLPIDPSYWFHTVATSAM